MAAGTVTTALIVGHGAAFAGEPHREVTAGDKETARTLMDEGDEKFRAGDYRGALAAYRAADKIMHVPTTGLEVGRAQDKLGLLLEARDTLLHVARYPRRAAEPEPFTAARNEARRMAAALGERIPSLKVVVEGLAEGVEVAVRIDDVVLPAGTHRHPRKVNPGEKEIVAAAPGYATASKRVEVAEGQNLLVELVLEPTPSPNDEPTSPTHGRDGEQATGAAGISSLVWVGVGVGAVGMAAGAVTGALSLAATSEVTDSCEQDACPPSVESDIEYAELLANISNVGFAVGGVGVLLGIVGIALSGDEPGDAPTEQARGGLLVEPFVGPASVGLRGKF